MFSVFMLGTFLCHCSSSRYASVANVVCESREAESPWFGYSQQYDGHELAIFMKVVLFSQYKHGGPMNMRRKKHLRHSLSFLKTSRTFTSMSSSLT
jgi:hypothetical protein